MSIHIDDLTTVANACTDAVFTIWDIIEDQVEFFRILGKQAENVSICLQELLSREYPDLISGWDKSREIEEIQLMDAARATDLEAVFRMSKDKLRTIELDLSGRNADLTMIMNVFKSRGVVSLEEIRLTTSGTAETPGG